MDLNLTPRKSSFAMNCAHGLKPMLPKDWSEWREKPIEESFTYLRAWQRKLYEGGWAAVSWPKEYGGRGAKLDAAIHFLGRNGARGSAADGEFPGSRLIGPTIIAYGTDAQKKRYIPRS